MAAPMSTIFERGGRLRTNVERLMRSSSPIYPGMSKLSLSSMFPSLAEDRFHFGSNLHKTCLPKLIQIQGIINKFLQQIALPLFQNLIFIVEESGNLRITAERK